MLLYSVVFISTLWYITCIMSDFVIVKRNLKDLKPYAKNPRNNYDAVLKVKASIELFGFKVPIVVDNNDVIVCGHTRYLAAKKLGLKEVPTIVASDLTDEQVRAFRLVDNKTHEFSSWDLDLLNGELCSIKDVDLSQFEFDFDFETKNDAAGLDEFDENVESIAQLGDLWQLGRHRVLCGDCTDKDRVEKLMDDKKATLGFNDPPYGMKKEKDGVVNDNLNFDDLLEFNKRWITVQVSFLKDNGSFYCWGIDEPLMDIYAFILKPLIKQQKMTFRNLLTWNKGSCQGQNSENTRCYAIADEKCLFVMMGVHGFNSNADNYFEGWEPIRDYLLKSRLSMGWDVSTMKKIAGHSDLSGDHWTGKSQFNLPNKEVYNKLKIAAEEQRYKNKEDNSAFKKDYDELKKDYDELKKEYYSTRAYFDNTHDNFNNVWNISRELNVTEHATTKPQELCCRAIKSSCPKNEIVLDCFLGSGSTLIACEQTNRICYGCEIVPKYVDVIIKRWEDLTGEKAVKIV